MGRKADHYWERYEALEPVVVVSQGLAGFSRGHEHMAVLSHSLVVELTQCLASKQEQCLSFLNASNVQLGEQKQHLLSKNNALLLNKSEVS